MFEVPDLEILERKLGGERCRQPSHVLDGGRILIDTETVEATPEEVCPMDKTRRAFLTTAGASAAGMHELAQAQDHDHEHQAVPSDLTLRVKALESLLVSGPQTSIKWVSGKYPKYRAAQ